MNRDQRKVDREGIHIDRSLADDVAIEEALDSNVVGPYRFPSPERRRLSAHVMVAFALLALIGIEGGWIVTLTLLALAAWLYLSAWPLNVDEHQAMRTAAAAVPFPVGHVSAAIRFRGWRSRPRWSVVVYSAAEPPDQRALVVVDAVDGSVAEIPYVEDVPLI